MPLWSCPTPYQLDGLNVTWTSVWLLFPGGFLLLFRVSKQIGPFGNLWPRATSSQSPFFNRSSRPNSLHFCVYQPTDSWYSCVLLLSRGSYGDLWAWLHFVILQLLVAVGSHVHPFLQFPGHARFCPCVLLWATLP